MLEFWPQDAPKHVENFVKLANEKFYDGQRVHRVEPNFVVQFGDPQSKTLPMDHPKMGSGGPGYTIKAEFNKRPFDRGVLGMARTNDPDSAGSQIYIMLGPSHFLNGKYTAFGKVASGMGVVDADQGRRPHQDRPHRPVTPTSSRRERKTRHQNERLAAKTKGKGEPC